MRWWWLGPIALSVVMSGVSVPATAAPPAAGGPQLRTVATSTVTPSARARTTVAGWSTAPAAAASTSPLRVAVRVSTGGVGAVRQVRVQRRAVGAKKWRTVGQGATTAAGGFTATLTAPSGRWQFRLRVPASKAGRSVTTPPRRVLVTRLMVAAGGGFSCALRVGGIVRCWGANGYGELGDGTRADRKGVVTVRRLSGATAIASGYSHTCAIVAKGRVRCWGHNGFRQLGVKGRGAHRGPVTVKGVSGATAIAAGGNHTCAVVRHKAVKCWGSYEFLDDEEHSPEDADATAPKRVPRLTGVTALAASVDFDCALAAKGRVRCWGSGWMGQLGDGTRKDRRKPVRVHKLPKATAIAAGDEHACALVTRGRVACWGANPAQGLGHYQESDEVPVLAPVFVRGLRGQVAVAAGGDHTCGLGVDGRVGCVGSNYYGELGNGLGGDVDAVTTAVIARGVRAVGISASDTHTCAQIASGPVLCWGDDSAGQLGDGTPDALSSSTPLRVHGLAGVRLLAAGGPTSCALTTAGVTRCWGGYSYTPAAHPIPTPIPGLTSVTALAPGAYLSCALLGDGTVSCWPYYAAKPPARVAGLADATTLSGEWQHCVVSTTGAVRCWDDEHPVRTVAGITGATDVSASGLGGCALVVGGQVRCWSGQGAPTTVPGLSQITKVSAGDMHACAVRTGGAVYCWGANSSGELGDGTFRDSAAPVRVRGVSSATAVGVGESFSCALLAEGTVRCWGNDDYGTLGDGRSLQERTSRAVPGPVVRVVHATSLAVGSRHACVTISDGTVRCWGNNESGELGQEPGWTPRRVKGL